MGKLMKALKFVSIIADVIAFVEDVVKVLEDRSVTTIEALELIESGNNILEKIK